MEKYLIVCDMDGTLLPDNKILPEEDIAYLKKLMAEGHSVVLASGRPPRAVLPYYEQLGLATPFISYSGAYVSSLKSSGERFSKEVILNLYHVLKKDYLDNIFVESLNSIYMEKEDSMITDFFTKDAMDFHLGKMDEILKEDGLVTVFHFKKGVNRDEIRDYIAAHTPYHLRHWTGAWNDYSELEFIGKTKGSALLSIREELGFDKEHTIAFGDASNDIPLLKEAGIAVAMTNAIVDFTGIATMMSVDDCNHHGVIKTLKNILEK